MSRTCDRETRIRYQSFGAPTGQPPSVGARRYHNNASRGLYPMDHTAFGDTPLSRCHFYRRVCDLPAKVVPPLLGRIIITAEHVWAPIRLAHLGMAVKTYVQHRGSEIGPILSHPRSNRWTLVRPDILDDVRLVAEVFRLSVSVVRTDSAVALPSPADKGAQFRRWPEPLRCMFRPSGLVVVDAIRACSGPYRPVRRRACHG